MLAHYELGENHRMASVPAYSSVISKECQSNSGPYLSSLHSLCDQPLHVIADQIAELI